jgi:hypothetical protein
MTHRTRWLPAVALLACLTLAPAWSADAGTAAAPAAAGATAPITKGQRIFTCGHSFHAFWINPILDDLAASAGIDGEVTVGVSKIGGSQVIQHWEIPDDQNEAKKALKAGQVDVLTLSPMNQPDVGIDRFCELAQQGNPNIRVTVQEFWLPWDKATWPQSAPADKDTMTEADLRALHAPYFATMDAYVEAINKKAGRQEVFIVPVGQAVIALRTLIIAGKVPAIPKQSDLFSDPLGHPLPPLRALAAYCHFAVIYRRTPVGLPMPKVLTGPVQNFAGNFIDDPNKSKWDDKLNLLLQQLAWDAVIHHPLSGVTAPN